MDNMDNMDDMDDIENIKEHAHTAIPEFVIETASQGEEGIIKIKRAIADGNPFALAFVDNRMPPGMDGIETIQQIWEIDKDIQVVICTAYSDYSWEETIKSLGLTENLLILKKPFDIVAVRQLTTALTQKWLTAQVSKKHTLSLKEKLAYQATHDVLTGLPNRMLLHDRIGQEIVRSKRNKTQFAVFFLDLDRFKFVNDTLGYDMGDKLLCAIAKRLKALLRKIDTIARMGGDEFILIFPSIKEASQAATIGHKILSSFDQPFVISGTEIILKVSLGISIYPQNGTKVNTLLSNSDMAMHQAKAQGGNQCAFYTEELNKKSKYFFQMEAELQRAVAQNEFFLVYQPQFDIHQHKVISIEALLRWQHPQKGVILPLEFVPIAESTGLIVPIGEWVIETACKQLIEWHKRGLPLLRIAVNVATKQLRQLHFPDIVEQILKKLGLDMRLLEIEVTENVIIDKEIQQSILKLKKLGCCIVLDDFGTGNSTLNTLKELQIDGLKIDRNFINNISKSRGDEAIVEAIIAISHTMNFKVIAEGVETEKQIEFLRSKHCDEIQGYLGSKPLTAEEFERFLRAG
jgi:diguanylate cyclase (GGDEF)-like protein